MNLSQFTLNGKFLMLALDHRGSFKKLMNPQNPDLVSEEEAINLKHEIIEALKDQFSGVLIDEVYGLQAYNHIKPYFLPYMKPYLLPLEKSGYVENLGERLTEIEHSAQEIIQMGASGAKILLYFNPSLPSAKNQIEIARRALEDCQQNDIPLFLEIRVYKSDTGDDIGDEVEELVLESLKLMRDNNINPQVWKLEYPGNFEACRKVTEVVGNTPWILLTKGSTFETFVNQLKQATEAGAQGFLAGRALWQEVGSLSGAQKSEFLQRILPERFKIISDIVKGSSYYV